MKRRRLLLPLLLLLLSLPSSSSCPLRRQRSKAPPPRAAAKRTKGALASSSLPPPWHTRTRRTTAARTRGSAPRSPARSVSFSFFFPPRSLRGRDDGKRKREYQNLPKQQQNLEPTGIADGVGGWAESGVCPAEYARELMAAARAAAEGTAPALVTPASLAAARGAAGRGGGGPAAAAAASGGGGSFPGVPIACFEAAGGGAPAPPHSSSSVASRASAAAAAAAREGAPPSRGEHGGASPPDSPPPAPPSAPSPPPPAEAAEIPKRALAAAHAAVRLPGSATACVAALDPETGTLHGVSVGDAALLVARRGFVLFRSTPSSHSFDCPRQLAAAPEHVEWSDGVEDGEAFEVEGLEEGDVVLLGTDGVFDNCWAAELLALLPTEATPRANAGGGGGGDSVSSSSSSSPLSLSARDIAEKIVLLAAANSRDETYPSPYAAEAAACGVDLRGGAAGKESFDAASSFGAAVSSFASKLFGGLNSDDEDDGGAAALLGGKVDDITIVVGVVGAVQ